MSALEIGKMYRMDPKDLKFLPGNRCIDVSHLNSLKTAMSKENLLDDAPVTINKDRLILDGQHRVAAALSLGIAEVPCRVRNGGLELAQKLNRHTRNWTLMDFATSYAAQGKKDYALFLEFKNRWKFGINETLEILCGRTHETWGTFRAGLFQVKTTEQEAKKLAELIEDFKLIVPNKGYKTRAFVLAFLKVCKTKGYSHKRMMHKCELVTIHRCADRNSYLEELDRVYNYKVKAEDKMRFAS